jgi:hypothetical protein
VPNVRLHQTYASDRLLIDLVREQPGEVAVIVLGPTTVLARAFDRDPELPGLIQRVICVGGTWHEPGNATAVAEFHFFCDPHSARRLLQSRIPITLLPLDVSRKALFSPSELMEMTVHDSRCCRFLKQIAFWIARERLWVGFVALLVGLFCAAVLRGLRELTDGRLGVTGCGRGEKKCFGAAILSGGGEVVCRKGFGEALGVECREKASPFRVLCEAQACLEVEEVEPDRTEVRKNVRPSCQGNCSVCGRRARGVGVGAADRRMTDRSVRPTGARHLIPRFWVPNCCTFFG